MVNKASESSLHTMTEPVGSVLVNNDKQCKMPMVQILFYLSYFRMYVRLAVVTDVTIDFVNYGGRFFVLSRSDGKVIF